MGFFGWLEEPLALRDVKMRDQCNDRSAWRAV